MADTQRPATADRNSIRTLLAEATATLRRQTLEHGSQHFSDTPWLDAVVLLGIALELSREQLFARMEDPLSSEQCAAYLALLRRRLNGEPIAYIRGSQEFFSRDFLVDSRVLIPRPDTEILVEAVLALVDRDPDITRVHDCCTGSGCVAITLALERPRLSVSASDNSESALEVCRENVRRLAPGRVTVFRSDLLAQAAGSYDLIVANPPYLTDDEVKEIAAAGGKEPAMALAAGADGLDVIRRLVAHSVEHLRPSRYLVIEGAFDQRASVFDVFHQHGLTDCSVIRDLSGRDRVYVSRRAVAADDSNAGGV